jgi:hypothetical protein
LTLLATLEDYAAARGVAHDPTDLQALGSLEAASGLVRSYTGQDFDFVESDEVRLHGSGTASLLVPQVPIVEVCEIALVADDDTEEAVEVADYRVEAAAGIVWRMDALRWPEGRLNIRLVYDHGYILPGEPGANLPPDLQMVTMLVAGRLLSSARLASTGVAGSIQQETLGAYSVTYGDAAGSSSVATDDGTGLVPLERAILDRYRLPRT